MKSWHSPLMCVAFLIMPVGALFFGILGAGIAYGIAMLLGFLVTYTMKL
jgi:hypothetical protein